MYPQKGITDMNLGMFWELRITKNYDLFVSAKTIFCGIPCSPPKHGF